MKVLVSGAEGFIGSHVVEDLVRRGIEVTAMYAYNFENRMGWLTKIDPEIRKSIDVTVCDLRDSSAVQRAVSGHDSIMHLGALIGIPYSYQAPDSYIQVNIQGTLNLLEASRNSGIERFVHVSTSEVYGSAQSTPMNELHRVYPQSPYAASKAAADHLAQSYYLSFNVPVVTIRPFNTFGPRQSNRAVIPTLINQFIQNSKAIKIGNLESTRDFTFVTDTASGMVAGLVTQNIEGELFNLGTGYDFSVLDIYETLCELSGNAIAIQQDPSRIRPPKSEVDVLLSDNSKAQKMLGWTPKYKGEEGFRTALEITYKWFLENSNTYNNSSDFVI